MMSKILHEVLQANGDYVKSFGDKGKLALPPARRFAILTCMDARIDPAKLAGLSEGDAHVIRNAGGRASDDAIRSLIISYKLDWLTIGNQAKSVATDVERIRNHPLVPKDIPIYGIAPAGESNAGGSEGDRVAQQRARAATQEIAAGEHETGAERRDGH
jgi:carbonic anhydrase